MIISISKFKVNNIISLLKQLYQLKTIKTTIVDTFILYVTTLFPKLNIKYAYHPFPRWSCRGLTIPTLTPTPLPLHLVSYRAAAETIQTSCSKLVCWTS